ncbi:MAG: Ig-like domain-containing protein, partial [Aeromonas sp.]
TATTTEGYGVDTALPIITVDVPENTNDTTPTITGTTDAPVGSVVTIVVTDSAGHKQTLTTTVVAGGSYSVDVVTPLPEGDFTANATVSDPAGNQGSSTDDGIVDVTAPVDLAITLDPNITADDIINAAEAGNAIPVSGKVSGEFMVGDVVTLTVNGKDFTGKVLGTDGSFSINVPGSDLVADPDHTIDASVTSTDAAGNTDTATNSEDYSVDTEVSELAIVLDKEITPDDVINAAEAGQSIPVSGTVSGEFNVGDTVTLTVNGKDFTGTVLGTDGRFTINVPGSDLAADSAHIIDASVTSTDAAGNTDTATTNEGYGVDTQAPSVVVDIVDNMLSVGETTEVTFTFSEHITGFDNSDLAVVGGTLGPVSSKDGGKTWTATFTPTADFTGTASVTVKEGSYTDLVGNQGSTGSDTAGVDTDAPDLGIVLDGNICGDNIINATEAEENIAIKGTVSGEFKVGDTVTLTVNGKPYTGTVLDSNGRFSIDVPGSDLVANSNHTIDASVTTTDAAGNSTSITTSETYEVDTTAPVPTITIDPNFTDDNIINAAESGGKIPVSGTVDGDFNPGDTVTLTINGVAYSGSVDANGKFTIDVFGSDLVADESHIINATVTTTDAAGNSGYAEDSEGYGVDIEVANLAVFLDANITPDNVINAAEAGTTIAVTGTAGGEFNLGDTVTLTVNNKQFTGKITNALTGAFSVDVPGSDLAADADKTIHASLTSTDAAGNTETVGDDVTYGVDTVKPVDLAITLDPNITSDGIINGNDTADQVPISGTVTGEFKEGDIVTITVNDNQYTGTVDANGRFSIKVGINALIFDPDTKVEASVTSTDAAGNNAEASTSQLYEVHLTPPTLSIELDADIAGDGIMNLVEKNLGTLPISGTVKGEFNAGDIVTLAVGNKTFTGTVDAQGHFSINVETYQLKIDTDQTIKASVTSTDIDGNSMTVSSSQGYLVDMVGPNVSIKLDDDITSDDVINAAEWHQSVPVSGTVTGEFKAGDYVNVIVNGITFSGPVDANGRFTIEVLGSALIVDHNELDSAITANITLTDAAGNSTTATDTEHFDVDVLAPNTLHIVLDSVIAGDDTINGTEAGQNVPISGTVSGEFNVGDTVTLSVHDKQYTGLVGENGRFSIDVAGSDLVADADHIIHATVTSADSAGNTYTVKDDEGYGVDLTATDVPIVIIMGDRNNDGVLSGAETFGNTVQVSVIINGTDLEHGGHVTLTIDNGGVSSSVVLTYVSEDTLHGSDGKDYSYNGYSTIRWDESTPADGKSLSVSVTQTDKAGNTSVAGSDAVLVDISDTQTVSDDLLTVTSAIDLNADMTGRSGLFFDGRQGGAHDGMILDNFGVLSQEHQGYANDFIPLGQISAALANVDADSNANANISADGVHTQAVYLSGLPEGALLTDGTHSVTSAAGSPVDVSDWSLDALQMKTEQVGDYTLTVETQATHSGSADTQSSMAEATVSVLPTHSTIIEIADEDTSSHSDADGGALLAVNSGDEMAAHPIFAGLGSQILCGSDSADMFVWSQQDKPSSAVNKDVITDFNQHEGDKLDLRDLLDPHGGQGQDDMRSLLSVFESDEGVHLEIKDAGSHSVTQEIVLADHSFDSLTGDMGSTASQVIDYMLTSHMLELNK